MKIAVVYQFYQGHNAPGHSLVYELAQHLALEHEVSVISGETGYMNRTRSQRPWYRRLLQREADGRVQVLRTYTYVEKTRNTLGRVLNFASFALSCPLGLLSIAKPDIALLSSPPIFPMSTAAVICKLRGIPFVMEVRDLWPSSAVEMGVLRNRKLIAAMSWMERFLYNHSSRIVALTNGIRDDIVGRGWASEKVEVVTCGVDFDRLYYDADGGTRIRDMHGWGDKTVVMYFGALGVANNIPVILAAAKLLRARDDILFVIVGDGAKKDETLARIEADGLANVQLLPPVPKEQARRYLSAADIGLATLLDIPLFHGAIPTKLLDYMACARPVLCGIQGEAKKITTDARAGLCFAPDDGDTLAQAVAQLAAAPETRRKMGAAGLAHVRQHYSAISCRKKMARILQAAAIKQNRGTRTERP